MITALGWLGTGLVLASYTQTSLRRLRRLSLTASLVLIVFNAALGIWSNVALEVALVGVNLHLLRRERTSASPASARDLVEVAA
jgi:hypothetical protein